jgi:hypothetical protein
MRMGRIGLVGAVAGVVLSGLVAVAGCEGADGAGSGGDEAELRGGFPFHHHQHRGPDAGSVGGNAGGATGGGTGVVTGGTAGGGSAGTTGVGAADGGSVADCEICTQAQRCCEVVEVEEQSCSFSAATCSAEPGAALPAYINACLTFVVTVRGAWGGNPPAECR